ncbi:tail assembly protein, partial [Escherichia coli]|uniref:tail assembly protein n=1 Tax=Escherichia coli TaxID=562 RepID=UPI00044709BC
IVGSFFTAGASMALWGSALAAGGFSATTMLFSLGASMILGGVAQMLAPKAKTPEYRATDNGRQNTYFSSLDNMIAQGNPMPVPYGEMLVGSRRISQDISTRDEGGDGKVVVIGRGMKIKKSRSVWRLREQKMKINHREFCFYWPEKTVTPGNDICHGGVQKM